MSHEYTDETGQRVLVLTRNEAIDRLNQAEFLKVYNIQRALIRGGRALAMIPRERLAQEFVNEYERRTGRTWGALAYLARLASECGASVDSPGVSNWKTPGGKYADGLGTDNAIRAAIDKYLDL